MANGPQIYLIVLLISLFFEISVLSQPSQQCSAYCLCDTWYSLERASCIGRHLYSIHTGAPNNVQALDLSDNVISLLSGFELANIGLTKLKYLNLSKNAISEIDLNAFNGLADLTVLDLSNNRLYYILDGTFEGNKNLQILKLSKNNFRSHVPKLQAFWLTELSLDSCQISHLPSDTFDGLTHVRRLDLSNNLMIQMSSNVVQTLHFLNKLSLEGNPWSCNKIMHELQTYLKHRNIEFDEVCSKKEYVQKFERMVVLPTTKSRDYHHSANADVFTEKTTSVTKPGSSSTLTNINLTMCEQMINQTYSVNPVHKFLPFSLLCLGFIFGISSGLVISYIWLSRKYPCCRRNRHHERLNDELIVSQEYSLLNSYLQGYRDSDRNLIESCPGTPPPPYREVMFRRSLYPCPSVVTVFPINDVYSERYT
ncbi:Immunoglobulin superfamily member 10 [Eufriesea mexicana]|uniref:leucine-rich repeat-containing protein 24-like n=1 Tax=Eufriesea mexicana TaxID=516756 RepID=UPI00083C6037|nr:PREDICTED: leucine-rich repeat-containing protein 24-like [Eufriesea mexicana]XP_017754335.1 PREDICTED: leucine-rich repeat-containing protein 24-like [Eufriesea mexicana]XP_017754336.1 PREDICTED: leucine-rich repeat-containing protein 24-like [Eufriesea mexicana]OAD58946.1 Immunoglobulin superfamily member 10 [Eufriesea mexicana]